MAQLAAAMEPLSMPRPYAGPLIDAHHHLWDLRLARHPWLAAEAEGRGSLGDLGPLRRNYLPQDYRRDAARQNMVASLHVEAGWLPQDCLGETRWLASLDRSGGVARRWVAHVPLASPDAQALIERQAAHPDVVGIRDILSFEDDPARRFAARGDLMFDPAWRAGLSCLVPQGLVFDLMILPSQMRDATKLVADFPEQLFVLNHCGSPIDRDDEGMRRWRNGLASLARAQNVALKISDLVAYDHDWTPESLEPVVRHCIDCFGTARTMFASDFPVAGLHASFDQIFDGFRAFTADLSDSEQSALFYDNAKRIYRFDDEASPPARLPS
jgi:predicted TIM-barrel fold metal-dependent hydrolase